MKKKQETPFQEGIKAFLKRLGLSQRKLADGREQTLRRMTVIGGVDNSDL